MLYCCQAQSFIQNVNNVVYKEGKILLCLFSLSLYKHNPLCTPSLSFCLFLSFFLSRARACLPQKQECRNETVVKGKHFHSQKFRQPLCFDFIPFICVTVITHLCLPPTSTPDQQLQLLTAQLASRMGGFNDCCRDT